MLYEYILTAFKVLIGLLNNKRIIYIAIVALAILLLWELFSLLFSYQIRFAKGVRNINEYISRNGISGINKDGLDELISKMPTEFVRGYSAYERDVHTLPSQHIKREIVLDLELQGGVFKQRALVNVYVNLVFIMLSLFCVALISNESPLTGYSLAEAFVVPLFFLLISKIIYNIYSAIRQNQYKIAIYEFNEMINNFDRASISEYGYYGDQEDGKPKVVQTVQAAPVDNKTNEELQNIQNQLAENKTKIDEFNQSIVDFKLQLEEFLKEKPSTEVSNATSVGLSEDSLKEIQNIILTKIEEINNSNKNSFTAIEKSVDEKMDELGEKIKNIQVVSVDALSDIASRIERKNEQANVVEEKSTKQQKTNLIIDDDKLSDNFKPDFNSIFEPEAEKRGRGRPKKEVTNAGEFVIKSDKEFEEALTRAEKLMRKNEEPLSTSQTKRVEKQIKELIDAMNKYKAGK